MVKKSKSSPIWLIVLLCAIILLLYAIITSVKHQSAVDSLNQQIQTLREEVEEQRKVKIAPLPEPEVTPEATSSASLAPKTSP